MWQYVVIGDKKISYWKECVTRLMEKVEQQHQ